MTRILYWNISNFTLSKVESLKGLAAEAAAQDRLRHILSVIAPAQARPLDMIVLVEVYARNGDLATPRLVLSPNSNAGQAVLILLNEIRDKLGNDWCLIPPPMVGNYGKREGVAIFYNSATLTFTGPWVYAEAPDEVNKIMPPTPASLGKLADYPPGYAGVFPAAPRTWTAEGGVQVPESQGAPQITYNGNFPSSDDRPPVHVRMVDTANRTIEVYAVHTSPASAEDAVRRISYMSELERTGDNEISVVVGDFNWDSFITTKSMLGDPYKELRISGFNMLLNSRIPGTTLVQPNRRPYCMTHLLPNQQQFRKKYTPVATPYYSSAKPDPQHNAYPRLGYMGSMSPGSQKQAGKPNDTGAIDNAFVRYGSALAKQLPHTTIVNTVGGQPYDQVQPLPDGVTDDLTSGLPQQILMIMWQPAMVSTGFAPGSNIGDFNTWDAYGHIYGVSDHLALIFDV